MTFQPEQILSRSVGVIANANTELLFSGVSLRTFEFQWQMSPRDELEAANVRMIIRAFKQWSVLENLQRLTLGSEEGTLVSVNCWWAIFLLRNS